MALFGRACWIVCCSCSLHFIIATLQISLRPPRSRAGRWWCGVSSIVFLFRSQNIKRDVAEVGRDRADLLPCQSVLPGVHNSDVIKTWFTCCNKIHALRSPGPGLRSSNTSNDQWSVLAARKQELNGRECNQWNYTKIRVTIYIINHYLYIYTYIFL